MVAQLNVLVAQMFFELKKLKKCNNYLEFHNFLVVGALHVSSVYFNFLLIFGWVFEGLSKNWGSTVHFLETSDFTC